MVNDPQVERCLGFYPGGPLRPRYDAIVQLVGRMALPKGTQQFLHVVLWGHACGAVLRFPKPLLPSSVNRASHL